MPGFAVVLMQNRYSTHSWNWSRGTETESTGHKKQAKRVDLDRSKPEVSRTATKQTIPSDFLLDHDFRIGCVAFAAPVALR